MNVQPCHMDKALRVALLDQQRKEEKQKSLNDASSFLFSNEESKKELDRLKKRYNIEVDNDFFTSDLHLFKSFTMNNPEAFLHFKRNSDISRTLIQNNFK